jgi:hypothetical protein
MLTVIMQRQTGIGGFPPIAAGPADGNARRQRGAFQTDICMHMICPVANPGYAISVPCSSIQCQLPVNATKCIFRDVFSLFQEFIAYICSATVFTDQEMLFYGKWLSLAQVPGACNTRMVLHLVNTQ